MACIVNLFFFTFAKSIFFIMNEHLIKLGNLTKLFGFKGELIFRLDNFSTSVIASFDWIFVAIHDEEVPFKVLSFRIIDTAHVVLHLNGINDENKAKQMVGNQVFMTANSLKLPSANDLIDHRSIIGWRIICNNENIGFITNIIENKTQILFEINYRNQLKFIPFVQEFIVRVDKKSEAIHMDLPDGLLDL